MSANISEKELISLAQQGNKDALEKLLKLHEGYIYKLILGHEVPYEECNNMFNYCVLGVIEAIKHFDLERDVKFLTYAHGYILDALETGLRETFNKVRIPRSAYKKYAKAKKVKRTKTEEQFTSYLEDEGMAETFDLVSRYESMKSLDYSDEFNVESMVVNTSFEEGICETLLLNKYINQLTEDQQKVIRYFYYEDRGIQEIMDIMDLKKYQVDYLKSSALKTLKCSIKESVLDV